MMILALACASGLSAQRCEHLVKLLAAFMHPVDVRRVDATNDELSSDVGYYVRLDQETDTHVVVALVDASTEEPRVRHMDIDLPTGDSGDRLLAFGIKTELETRLEASLKTLRARPLPTRKLPSLAKPAAAPTPTQTASPATRPASAPTSVPAALPQPAPIRNESWLRAASVDARGAMVAYGATPLGGVAVGGNLHTTLGLDASLAIQFATTPRLTVGGTAISYYVLSLQARVGYSWHVSRALDLSGGGQVQGEAHIAHRSGVRTVAGPGGGGGVFGRLRWQPASAWPLGFIVDLHALGSFAAFQLVSDNGAQQPLFPFIWCAAIGIDVEFGRAAWSN